VAAVGYPLLHGPASGVADAAGLTIGSITVVPVTLAILENRTGNRNPNARAGDGSVVHSIVKALEKAVVWAPVLGIVFALFSIYLAKRLELSLATMGSATTGGALFLTGLVVSAQAFRLDRVVILSVLGKNIIQPAFCLLLATAIGMEPHQKRLRRHKICRPQGDNCFRNRKRFGTSGGTDVGTDPRTCPQHRLRKRTLPERRSLAKQQ
jgi:malonate transporter and related proteins